MARKKKMVMNLKTTMLSQEGKKRGQPQRTIAIENTRFLNELANTILESFNFNNDHDYGFYNNIKSFEKSESGYESLGDTKNRGSFTGVKDTPLSKVFHDDCNELLFLFDFASQWKFLVKLESITEFNKKNKYPSVIDSRGEATAQYNFDDDDFDLA